MFKEKEAKLRQHKWDRKYGIDKPYDSLPREDLMDYDDYDYEDDYDNQLSVYSGGDYYDDEDDYEVSYVDYDKEDKEIYFYENIDPTEDGLDGSQYDYIFNNIGELKKFCAENGIFIPKNEMEDIKYRYLTYCTLDPIDKAEGKLTLISDNEWEALWYQYHDLNEECAIKQ